jgi:hypothetical protein
MIATAGRSADLAIDQRSSRDPVTTPVAEASKPAADDSLVSVEAPKQWRIAPKREHTRDTITFPTESEARQFAKAMLSDGIKIMAGPLHPHQPMRRIVGSSETNQWIERDESNDPARQNAGLP